MTTDADMLALDSLAKLVEILEPGAMVQIEHKEGAILRYQIHVWDSHRLTSSVFGHGPTLEEAIQQTSDLCETTQRY